MIFSGNTTALGASTIPMAKGYDCSYGVGLALVEAARNDIAMFQALVRADYKEMNICKESTGVVQEGEISALHEAVGSGILKKIAELFKKLVAKIKSILHNFMAKLNGLFMKDKDLVKKYGKELSRKTNLDKLEVKWRVAKKDTFDTSIYGLNDIKGSFKKAEGWKDDLWDRTKFYLGLDVDSIDEYYQAMLDDIFKDEDTITLGEIGGWYKLAKYIENYDKSYKTIDSKNKKIISSLEAMVKDYDKAANNAVKDSLADKDNTEKADAVTNANKEYDMAQAYQTAILGKIHVLNSAILIEYKQYKAAFVKAITANDKKLAESAVYLNAVAEAAEDEVDNVINSALSDEEISDISVANTNVKDGDVSDDPDKLTYGQDCYDQTETLNSAYGSVDTCVGGGKVEESAYFGTLFY